MKLPADPSPLTEGVQHPARTTEEVLEEIALGEAELAAGHHVGWDELKAQLRHWRR